MITTTVFPGRYVQGYQAFNRLGGELARLLAPTGLTVGTLADFPEAIRSAAANYDSYDIAAYLLRLCGAFNKVYQRKDAAGRIDKIISDDKKLSAARMALLHVGADAGLELVAALPRRDSVREDLLVDLCR